MGEPLDLQAISDKWLDECGPCDLGLPYGCTHPQEDYRPVIATLLNEVGRLRSVIADEVQS